MRIVGYETCPAALLLSDGDDRRGGDDDTAPVRRRPLDPGDRIAYGLGDRRCAGRIARRDGRRVHVPCPDAAGVAPRCEACAETWVCARCTGSCLKDEMDCHADHAVYLAAFAPDAFKIGVTRLERLDTRLREQGADRAAHLRTVTNGRVAREIEAGIAERVGDAVRTPTKRRGLHLSVDEAAWSDLLSGFDPIDTAAYRYDHDVETRPLAATTAAGRVRGAQGRLLVLNRHGTTYAVDLRDLVGHAVTGSTDERALQSSLGAF